MKTKSTPEILFLSADQLLTHPKNMRRFYPADQVREMANSIQAAGGVLQSMLIVPADVSGKYFVVDGNMRLAGARLLGDKCPPLKCEPIAADKAAQLLAMTISNTVRFDPDPVSEGLHYKALIAEGLTVRGISKRTGVYEARIYTCLAIVELDEPIQQLIAEKRLPKSDRVVKALLSITNAKARIQLAERLASNPETKIITVERAAERLREMGHRVNMVTPALELALGDQTPAPGKRAWKEIREASRQVCVVCDLREYKMPDASNPAWSAITHAADETCGSCNLQDVQTTCNVCPAVELIRRLVPGGHPEPEKAPVAGKEKSNGRGK